MRGILIVLRTLERFSQKLENQIELVQEFYSRPGFGNQLVLMVTYFGYNLWQKKKNVLVNSIFFSGAIIKIGDHSVFF